MVTITQTKQIFVDKNILDEYSTFVDLVAHERNKLYDNYIKSDSLKDLINYLDN